MGSAPVVAFATSAEAPTLYEEESGCIPKLGARGLHAEAAVWNDPAVDWRRFSDVVLRSTWDYFEHSEEFAAWLNRLEGMGVRLHNSFSLVRWNMDKRYLRELQERGASVVPTQFIDRNTRVNLAKRLGELGWREAVLKPTLSGGAFRTFRFTATEAASHQEQLDEILAQSGALLQPFLPEVQTEGEWSLFFFGGAFSHAVLKTPAERDFRVQTQFGGRFTHVTAEDAPVLAASAVMRLLPEAPLYARIDGVRQQGRFLLMEVEAIEPYLFTKGMEAALDRYVDSVARAVAP